MPSIILVVDNVDGFNTQTTKEIVAPLQRLVTMGYKAGIFVILSTTELSYKAMPNELLNLIPERISFRLNSKEEYKKLYGTTNVDILYENGTFHYNIHGRILIGDSAVIPLNSIEAVVDFIGDQRGYPQVFLLPEQVNEDSFQN
ncbi:MAG TPA: hypothetical protein VJU78_13065 [Chitinophagaceae bacterium]|nr:hypothetical protein [Chitinophagaceae bacterium]